MIVFYHDFVLLITIECSNQIYRCKKKRNFSAKCRNLFGKNSLIDVWELLLLIGSFPVDQLYFPISPRTLAGWSFFIRSLLTTRDKVFTLNFLHEIPFKTINFFDFAEFLSVFGWILYFFKFGYSLVQSCFKGKT